MTDNQIYDIYIRRYTPRRGRGDEKDLRFSVLNAQEGTGKKQFLSKEFWKSVGAEWPEPPVMKKPGSRWTEDEDTELLECVEMGLTSDSIAAILRRSRGAVKRRIQDLRNAGETDATLVWRPPNYVSWDEQEDQELIALYRQGYGPIDIAPRLKKEPVQVTRRAAKLRARGWDIPLRKKSVWGNKKEARG